MNRVSAGEQQQQQTAEQLQSKQQHADVQRFEKDDTTGDNDKARCRKTAAIQQACCILPGKDTIPYGFIHKDRAGGKAKEHRA